MRYAYIGQKTKKWKVASTLCVLVLMEGGSASIMKTAIKGTLFICMSPFVSRYATRRTRQTVSVVTAI